MKEYTVKVMMPEGKYCVELGKGGNIYCPFNKLYGCGYLRESWKCGNETKLSNCPAKEEGKDGTD